MEAEILQTVDGVGGSLCSNLPCSDRFIISRAPLSRERRKRYTWPISCRGLDCLQQPAWNLFFNSCRPLPHFAQKVKDKLLTLTEYGKPRLNTIAAARALNDIIREAQTGGATFATIDKLSKNWSEKAGLMRFPEVSSLLSLCGSETEHSLCGALVDQQPRHREDASAYSW